MRCATICLGVVLGFADLASAAPVMENGQTAVHFAGFGRAQLLVQDGNPALDEAGFNLVMARLRGRVVHRDLGELDLVVEAMNPDRPLLDLIVDVNLGSPYGFRAGVFRVPFSREMLRPIASLPTYDRTLLTGPDGYGPRRAAGADVYGAVPLGGATLRLNLGAFNPDGEYDARGEGVLALARVQLAFDFGLDLHVAYLEHTLGQARDPRTDALVFPDDGPVDVALFYEAHGLRALAEAIIVTRARDDATPFGLHGSVGYLFDDLGRGFGLEPAVGFDHLDDDRGATRTRVTGNLHWLLRGRDLQVSLGAGLDQGTGRDDALLGLLELQGGF